MAEKWSAVISGTHPKTDTLLVVWVHLLVRAHKTHVEVMCPYPLCWQRLTTRPETKGEGAWRASHQPCLSLPKAAGCLDAPGDREPVGSEVIQLLSAQPELLERPFFSKGGHLPLQPWVLVLSPGIPTHPPPRQQAPPPPQPVRDSGISRPPAWTSPAPSPSAAPAAPAAAPRGDEPSESRLAALTGPQATPTGH